MATTYRLSSPNQIRTASGAVGEPPDSPGESAKTVDDIETRFGFNGIERVATTALRDAIPAARKYTNKQVRVDADGITYVWTGSAWVPWNSGPQNYTPTVANLTLGNGTLSGSYQYVNGVLYGNIVLIAGSTTTASGALLFNTPAAAPDADTTFKMVGEGYVLDASANAQQGVYASLDNARRFALVTAANGTTVAASTPFAISTSDQYHVKFRIKF